MTIGIIGLGLLGTAIAERLLAAGFDVVGFDISQERNVNLQKLGGRALGGAAEVLQSCTPTLLSLPTSDIVGDLLAQMPPDLPGKTIIDTTTGEPVAMDEIGRNLARRGADYLVASVGGSSAQVRRGEAIVMTGGSDQLAAHCDDVLRTFSRQRFHLGTWIAAARMKLVTNHVLGLNRAVLAEGLAFARACGLNPRQVLEVLKAGPAFSLAMETKGERMLSYISQIGDAGSGPTESPPPEARLIQHYKDVQLMMQEGETVCATLTFAMAHQICLETVIAMGYGDEDNSAVISFFLPDPSESEDA
jgi:3-hydroxyisobutyrate dehydrogenase-like beta-hydroxyacid dehydrogenase